ncbi:monooxygenase [Bacillus amyloliquefaciens]|uniref:monooxygenase n=1 Tax=Bacillus amyloliquefaciens TaxID=1390 RepID=UPI00187329A0|nr:monooxygenase [Bacillus amyloliquefaciens]QOQ56033.1 monooxygenase [Bacillus amyloliquefaciens]
METQAAIIGGGPVGLMLASELALAGVKTTVIERLKKTVPYSKALIMHPRTLELFAMRGILGRFLDKGTKVSSGHFSMLDTRLDFSRLDSKQNYSLMLPQAETERLLEEYASSLGANIIRGAEAVALTQTDDGVETVFRDESGIRTLRSLYAAGTDGAGSIVRKQAGIAFLGTDADLIGTLCDAVLKNPPESAFFSVCRLQGSVVIVPLSNGLFRVLIVSPHAPQKRKEEPVTENELKEDLREICGTDFGLSDPVWMSRFGNAERQAEQYRSSRVFVAGDAAHIHFPAGGQGLNTGLQDAFNLGWKLAAQIKGKAAPHLLDSYHQERHSTGKEVLHNIKTQIKLMDFTESGMALRDTMTALLDFQESNRLLAGKVSALDLHYEPDPELPRHRLNGKRLPDIELTLHDGRPARLYDFLHKGAFVLLSLRRSIPDGIDTDSVEFVRAELSETRADWDDVHSVLIRPDGHAAWAAGGSGREAEETVLAGMERWGFI